MEHERNVVSNKIVLFYNGILYLFLVISRIIYIITIYNI